MGGFAGPSQCIRENGQLEMGAIAQQGIPQGGYELMLCCANVESGEIDSPLCFSYLGLQGVVEVFGTIKDLNLIRVDVDSWSETVEVGGEGWQS